MSKPLAQRAAGTHRARIVFTEREAEIMAHLVAGATNKQIGQSLGLSAHTVRDHVSRMLAKADAKSRGELIARHMSGSPPQATQADDPGHP